MSDQDIMARTIWGEARGEGQPGMEAVANVILNRNELWHVHPHFGHGTVQSVCLAPWQFSCWNENDPNAAKLKAVSFQDPVFAQCLQVASDAIAGIIEDNTNGATYYYVKNSPQPTWATGKEPCAEIGRHLFFKDIA